MTKKVLLAMSGGVDSSTAAVLLQKQGFQVIGATMDFGDIIPGASAVADAKRVAEQFGIEHHTLDCKRLMREEIIFDFLDQYKQGRTPNPCIRCNRLIKFGYLFEKAKELGCTYLATGHYARIEGRDGQHVIIRGDDDKKDQSYFLYRIPKEILSYIMLPLGMMTKDEVYPIAREHRIPAAEKPQSQDVCFLKGIPKKEFLSKYNVEGIPGEVVDMNGVVLGEHPGIVHFTRGQRAGLRIAVGYPLYIVDIDAVLNRIIVGKKEDTLASTVIAKDVNLFFSSFPARGEAKIRYGAHAMPCAIVYDGETLTVTFDEPCSAITPGQSVVVYDGDVVVGGGIIEESRV